MRNIAIGLALSASAIAGGVMTSPEVEAAPQVIEQGYPNLPNDCDVLAIGSAVPKYREELLISVGFSGINANGKVDKLEQKATYGAQILMQQLDVIPSNVKICGVNGAKTETGAKNMLNPGDVNESQLTQSPTSSRNNVSNSNPNTDKKVYKLEDCKNFDDMSVDTVKAIQRALGVVDDGVFGNRTCNAMINFQESKGIAQYGKGFLGNRTLTALGILNPQKKTPNVSDVTIDKVVIDKSDKLITAFDDNEVVSQFRISHGDDRPYSYIKNGMRYTGVATTRTGTSKVYRTEGADYASKTLGGPAGSMGYARFFDGGLAVHVGNTSSASHGCIRVGLSNMETLVEQGFGIGDRVVVQE